MTSAFSAPPCITGYYEYEIDASANEHPFTIFAKQYTNCDFIINKNVPDIIVSQNTNFVDEYDKSFRPIEFTISIGTFILKVNTKSYPTISTSSNNPKFPHGASTDVVVPRGNRPGSYYRQISQNFYVDLQMINTFYRFFITTYSYDLGGNHAWISIKLWFFENQGHGFQLNFQNFSLENKSLRTEVINEILVPAININGQTLIDSSDIGEVIFNISDKYDYKCNIAKNNNGSCQLENISVDELIITNFNKACVKIVSVVIGTGENLRMKVGVIWNSLMPEPDFNIFYENFLRYCMLRYILSKILYGNFDVNYLLQQYYTQFLIDLNKSRFCNFLQFFKDPIYSNMYTYFLHD